MKHESALRTVLGVPLASSVRSIPEPDPIEDHGADRAHDTLHVIDVENICGSALPSQETVTEVLESYRRTMGFGPGHLAILGASPQTAFFAGLAWPEVQTVQGRGKDGRFRSCPSEPV